MAASGRCAGGKRSTSKANHPADAASPETKEQLEAQCSLIRPASMKGDVPPNVSDCHGRGRPQKALRTPLTIKSGQIINVAVSAAFSLTPVSIHRRPIHQSAISQSKIAMPNHGGSACRSCRMPCKTGSSAGEKPRQKAALPLVWSHLSTSKNTAETCKSHCALELNSNSI